MTKSSIQFLLCAAAVFAVAGCGSSQAKEDRAFHTSGSREADQRAEQRMAKDEQLKGKAAKPQDDSILKPNDQKLSLYEKLGGETGMSALVDDFVTRALADPRVNWQRKGVTQGGWSFHRNQSVEWKPTDDQIKTLKFHIAQFLTLASGGPSKYEGKQMKDAHQGLHISNAEFDASVGDLKASLDKMQVKNQEQKELLAIVESTRPQIVQDR